MSGQIVVATCQFAEGFDPAANAAVILRYMRQARSAGADLLHTHEACLSGYLARRGAPAEPDWPALTAAAQAVRDEAARLGLWVVLGTAHRLMSPHNPTNCLYLIGPDGRIRDRYDKRFCTAGDLGAYTPGDRFVVFELNGVRCGLLICFDLRFCELYRELKRMGVEAIFQSFHNGYMDGPGIHTHIMRQTVQAHAGMNFFWISANNSTGRHCRWPSVFIRPDGFIAQSLRMHRAGMMLNTIDTSLDLYDASRPFRQLALDGVLHSGQLVDDQRQKKTDSL